SADQASTELADELERIYLLPQDRLVKTKQSAYRAMRHVDWGSLVENYYRAYALALEKKGRK
ncbi:MAG: hypothetical protein WC717_04645, partial [Candidatus Micrarchaeia archaeon]